MCSWIRSWGHLMVSRLNNSLSSKREHQTRRSAFSWLTLLVVLLTCSWAVYYFQYERLPLPLEAQQVGKRGFSEISAAKHVKSLTKLGPRPVGSDALDLALQYVLAAAEEINRTAHWEVNVEVDFFHANPGANHLVSGFFKGKTLLYSDLKHVVLKISPKYLAEANENTILVSSHIDTVFSTEGAGDCGSCIAVMLELARGISHLAHGFKNTVIFLFNTGEEDGLNGAHSFVTQHPWRRTVRLAIDLEAMGIGGKSIIFQSGPDPWAMENFARVAKYPSANICAQDLFRSGAVKSATDFQIYQEVAGLSGLDFAFVEANAVYHTKNDKLALLKPGSLQHLGDNMLAFLREAGCLPLPDAGRARNTYDDSTYFDVLGIYLVVYNQHLTRMLYNSVVVQTLLIWVTSLLVGGTRAFIALGLSCISIGLMWMLSLAFSIMVAFILPSCTFPTLFVTNPWLIVGLFGAPALLGALIGQYWGYVMLQKYLSNVAFRHQSVQSPAILDEIIQWEVERWLFKAGFVQWLIVLTVGNIYHVGSTYLALVWLVSPAFAYGLMEATLSPVRSPKQLKIVTLVFGLSIPVIISAGTLILLMRIVTGMMVHFDGSPGSIPEWLGNVVISLLTSSVVCLTFVYLASYVHTSGNKRYIFLSIFAIFGITLVAVVAGIFPSTEDIARTVNVVHVVETTGKYIDVQRPVSYITLFSNTPGKLTKEVDMLEDEEFVCGKRKLDLVTFNVNYQCQSYNGGEIGWNVSEIPVIMVESDADSSERMTRVSIDTKISNRWALAINMDEVEDFEFEGEFNKLVPTGRKSSVHGRHIIQFAGGKNSPKRFVLNLFRLKKSTRISGHSKEQNRSSQWLLKLRTDVNRLTTKASRVLNKLPSWCSVYGKSTSPYTLAFIASLPTD